VLALLSELDPDGDRVARFSVHSASLDDGFMTLTGHRPTRTESETANV
jgi:ABC-2 type transport system ATP-binding protein